MDVAIADGTPCPKCGCEEQWYPLYHPKNGDLGDLSKDPENSGHCLTCNYEGPSPYEVTA